MTTAAGFVLGALSPLGSQLAGVALDPDVVADRFRASDPIDIQVEQFHENSRGWARFAFADPLDFTSEEEQLLLGGSPAGPEDEFKAYRQLVESRSGVPIDFVNSNITLTGTRDQGVRVRDIRVVIDEIGPPLSGGILCDYEGGADEPTIASRINLDAVRPTFEVSYDSSQTWQPLVSSRSITLARKEQVTFNLSVRSERSFVRYHLALDLEVGGEPGTLVIDDFGQPFAITARAASAENGIDATAYRSAWTFDVETSNFVKGSPSLLYSPQGVCLG